MKLNINNYFDQVASYMDFINADAEFKTTYNFINRATRKGDNLSILDESDSVREVFALFLENLNKVGNKPKPAAKAPAKKAATKTGKQPVNTKTTVSKTKAAPKAKQREDTGIDAERVEHIPSDIALVKKYVSLHDKDKTYDQVLSISRAFNKAIVERKVVKDSPYKTELTYMNDSLKNAAAQAYVGGSIHLVIPAARLKGYNSIVASVEKSPAVNILLEYINIAGRYEMQQRAERLIKRIDRTIDSGKLTGDRYFKEVKKARTELETYINHESDNVPVNDFTLSGIGEIAVLGCPCQDGLKGFSRSQNAVIVKLIDEKVKNLTDCELDRAFADTVAPTVCKAIATKLIEVGQINMALLRNPAKVRGGFSLNGSVRPKHYDLNAEILDMRLKGAAAKDKQEKNKHSPKNIGFSGTDLGDVPITTEPEEVKIVSAIDMMNMKFKAIGLTGKYRKLIGDPEPGFSAMIYGKPFQGKSTMAIDFAKDLTAHGKVLYCVYEEGHGKLLQDKIERNKASVPGLDFADKLPSDLSPYQFAFIDSVTDARMNEDMFGALIKTYKPKGTSIIGVFHATKDGKFRGGQTFAHDADILIRIENGIAYAQGRYAPPSQINVSAIKLNSGNSEPA